MGEFNLTELPAAPRGVPQIEVTFKIDVNGILAVKAVDKGTGKEASIEVKGSGGLSDEEIEKMRRDAEAHAEDDKKRKLLVELKNTGDQTVYSTERLLNGENAGKISGDLRGTVESALSTLKDNLKGDDAEAIRRATDAVNEAAMKIGEQMYAADGGTAGAAADGDATGGPDVAPPHPEAGSDRAKPDDEDVIDAEYEVKKD